MIYAKETKLKVIILRDLDYGGIFCKAKRLHMINECIAKMFKSKSIEIIYIFAMKTAKYRHIESYSIIQRSFTL